MSLPEGLDRVTLRERVLTIAISQDAAGNSLDAIAFSQSIAAFNALDPSDFGAILFVGAGKNFCAGGNVRAFSEAADRPAFLQELADNFHNFIRLVLATDTPIVAGVRGWAAGAGLSLVTHADVAIGGPSTQLVAAYAGIGLSPDGGMSWTLPRIIGLSAAREMILTNSPLSGSRAVELGLLTRLTESDDDVVTEAFAVAAKIAAGPTDSLRAARKLLSHGTTATLDEQMDAEGKSISFLGGTPNGIEGVDAFVSKRPPRY